ncbi:hypothetical protein [Streptomyces sp. NPDC007205]|uniref:hypothetical protein n=1 Tax=Streptomyces sp. NPDC007205 TaxID=3154316 RepID=UPI0033EBC923
MSGNSRVSRLRLREAWRYYLLAWTGPPAVAGCTLGLAAGLGLWHPHLSGRDEGAGLGRVWPMVLSAVPLAAVCGWIGVRERARQRS